MIVGGVIVVWGSDVTVDAATAIAKELGILKEGTYALTGAKLNEMSDEELDPVFQFIIDHPNPPEFLKEGQTET